ncbi:hypothetical protein Tco_0016607 [Tanacetum coccineum]
MYKDVNVKLKDVEHREEGKGDAEMTDAGHDDVTQETTYDQVEDDAHVTLTTAHVSQKTEVPLQTDIEIISMMNVDVRHKEPSNQTPSLFTIPVTVIPKTLTTAATTILLPIPPFIPPPHQSTPTPTPTPIPTTTIIRVLPNFSSLFEFNQRVSNLEKGMYELKQADQSAQLLTTIKLKIPAMVDAHLGTRLEDYIQKALRSYTTEFEKEAQAEKKRYINLIEKSVKDVINDEVKTQLPQILPKALVRFATPVIKSTNTESLEDVFLAKSSSQPQSTYEAEASLTEFELKKIMIVKMEKSQSNLTADKHKELYKALVNSYNIDKYLFLVYGKDVSLKRGHEDKDKDEDPPAGLDQGMKGRKTSKDAESTKGSKSKESKSTSSSKGTTHSQPKSSGKSAQAEEQIHIVDDIEISKIAQAEKPPLSFDELMSTPIDFSAYVMNHLKIDNLTQDHLVGPVFNLLEGTCKTPEGKEYPFDLSKPLPLFMDRGRQVVLVDYFINNDLEYLRGGSSSKKYTTSTTKTKAAKYDIQGIEDMVPSNSTTRRIVILKRVKDLQLGVESYQKKLNITKPETFRLMRTDKLYKFSDGTLTSVRSVLHDIASNLKMDYLLKRRWSSLDRKRSRT